jgi:hypothetical protein
MGTTAFENHCSQKQSRGSCLELRMRPDGCSELESCGHPKESSDLHCIHQVSLSDSRRVVEPMRGF